VGAKKIRNKLRGKGGADFDKAYIDNEVAYHKATINVVKNTLIPNATNDQLKGLLKKVVPILEGHLQYAKALQKRISK
jgi:putative membrane protein